MHKEGSAGSQSADVPLVVAMVGHAGCIRRQVYAGETNANWSVAGMSPPAAHAAINALVTAFATVSKLLASFILVARMAGSAKVVVEAVVSEIGH